MKLKPYPEYKESGAPWLGQVPGHWDVKRLGSMFFERRETVSDKDYPPLSVTKNGILPQLENAAKTNDGDNRKKVCSGDFVINSRSDRKGSSGLSKLTGSVSLINTVIRPTKYNGAFTHRLLKSQSFIEEFYCVGQGIVADLWSTKYSEMRTIMMPVPPKEEQTAIARFLDYKSSQIARFIRAKKCMIELLKEQKQAIINDAVTGKIDVRTGKPYPKYKESGVEWLGKVPEGWEVRPLYSSYNVQLGKMLDEKRITGTFLKPYLRNTDVQWHAINVDNLPQMDFAPSELSRFTLKKNDILVCEGGEPGRAAVWNCGIEDCCYQKALHRLRPRIAKEYPVYFCFVLQTAVSLNAFSREDKATILHLPNDQFRSHRFPSPSRAEQENIVTFINEKTNTIEQAILRSLREISLLQEYRARLIADVVTGKIDVRGIEVPGVPVEDSLAEDETEGVESEQESPDAVLEEVE